jgi:tetratricopeptide (TPR) repeat protein
MRITHFQWIRFLSNTGRCAAFGGLLAAWGCATVNTDAPSALSRMNTDLASRQYNQVVSGSNAFLAATPDGEGAAEALYLRGRAYEDQPNPTAVQAKANLQNARTAYIAALDHHPAPLLEAYIRASLANVAYFQDDYTTAAQQWLAAFNNLDRPDLKSWALYRAGVSQQRLGQFAKADPIFRQVQQMFPDTVPAQRAREHEGARSFYVQLSAFSTADRARAAAAEAGKKGLSVQVAADPQSHFILRTTAVPTYAAAEQLRQRLSGTYEGAFVFP